MQGWTPDFIPKLTEDAVSLELVDQIVPIAGADALRISQELAQKEGIFAGISGGATLAGALQVCEQAPEGANVLCMLPDTGERYLTTPLFEGISSEMTDDELAISASTPLCRFDAAPPAAAAQASSHPAASSDVSAFVDEVIHDSAQPVVLFALEWCEFCWSLRKMFGQCGIPYRSVDLDSVEYQENNRGGMIRSELHTRTSCETIPQVFVGGEFIGGCSEVFDAFVDGSFQTALKKNSVSFDESVELDPYALLPNWLHPR
jgi:cysteine synthase A